MKTFADLKVLDKLCGEFRKNYFRTLGFPGEEIDLHEFQLRKIQSDAVTEVALQQWQAIIRLFMEHYSITDVCRPLTVPDTDELPLEMEAKMLVLEAYIKGNTKDP